MLPDGVHVNRADQRISAVVLAAGRSARMGRDKALLPLGSEPFVSRLLRSLSDAGADPVIVVTTAPRAAGIADVVGGRALVIVNPEPDRGQLSSLQCALDALPVDAAAVLITPVDFPLVTRKTVDALVRAWRDGSADILRPWRAGRHGHPVLVGRRVAEALRRAGPDQTARTVMQTCARLTRDVPIEDEGAFEDVDTPEDYEAAVRKWAENEQLDGKAED
jgi:molybdenum cofactor cytidylyltransferase